MIGCNENRCKMSAWILPIHIYALLIPLILIPMIVQNESFLDERIFRNIFSLCCFLFDGKSFEICQNHLDEWYVTDDSASGNGYSLFDGLFLFYLGEPMLYPLWSYRKYILVKYLCLFLILIMPFMYYKKLLPFLPLTIIGLANTISAYFLFGQIIIFLQFFSIALTVVFFNKLIQTENQFYHGLTTLFASSGIVFCILLLSSLQMDRRTFTKLMGLLTLLSSRAWSNTKKSKDRGYRCWNHRNNDCIRTLKKGADVKIIDKEFPASGASGHSFSWINATYPKKPYEYNLYRNWALMPINLWKQNLT